MSTYVGSARNEFLHPGDKVEIDIERLGRLETFITRSS